MFPIGGEVLARPLTTPAARAIGTTDTRSVAVRRFRLLLEQAVPTLRARAVGALPLTGLAMTSSSTELFVSSGTRGAISRN